VEGYFSYDPEKAKALLAEANFVDDTPIVFRVPIGDPSMLAAEEMATVIQDNLREVGISTEIETSDAVTWMDAIRAPQNELTEMSWNLAPVSPDDVFNGVLSEASLPPGFNTSYWVNQEFEELLVIGTTSLDEADVNAAYMRCQEIVMEEVPIVPVCHRRSLYGVSQRVHNFYAMPSGDLYLPEVWVES
jgi:ABC-type transport system substrate-binding protein